MKNDAILMHPKIFPDPADVSERYLSRMLTGLRRSNTGVIPFVCVRDFIHPARKENDKSAFDTSSFKKMRVLRYIDSLEVVYREELPKDYNLMGG